MNWTKLGNVFAADDHPTYTHAMFPEVQVLNEKTGKLRIYYTHRDEFNYGFPTYLEGTLENDAFSISYNHHESIIGKGDIGNFDDSGVNFTSLVHFQGQDYFYYYGWNLGVTVPFRNAVGVARRNEENDVEYTRYFPGPIIDRSPTEPGLCATPCVIPFGDGLRMYFTQGTPWILKDGVPHIACNVAYADSSDGLNWFRHESPSVINLVTDHVVTTPFVKYEDGKFKMWYSYRGEKYRIGYAESVDGAAFERMDQEAGITVSEFGWDSEMVCYPKVFDLNSEQYMVYCGNDFGRSGFGLAKLQR